MEESPPLTLQNLEAALQCLILGTANLKQAESALLLWQKHQVNEYTSVLLCATLSPRVRLAALLSLKAVIRQSWKDRGRSQRQLLDEATKQQVRAVLLAVVTSGDHPLLHQETVDQQYRSQFNAESVVQDRTVQAAATACLVQVAIFDLPKLSQDLVPFLVSYVASKQQDVLQRRNALHSLEAILEELSEKRLLGVKQYMQTVASNYVGTLVHEASGLVSLFSSSPSTLDETLSEICLLLIRVIRYLLERSLSTIVTEGNGDALAAVDRWMQLILDFSAALLSNSLLQVPQQLPLQLCTSMWELIVNVQEAHPIAFARYLEPNLNMFYTVVLRGFEETSTIGDPWRLLAYYEERMSQPPVFGEKLTILALRFLANTASCSHYIPDETTNEAVPVIRDTAVGTRTNITSKGDVTLRTSDVQNAVNVVWSSFFSRERICNLADISACHLMRISPEAIEEWAADPESYFVSEEHRAVAENLSLAAQFLYCSLAESQVSKKVVLARLVCLLGNPEWQLNACRHELAAAPYAHDDSSTSAIHPSILLCESLYTAVGLSISMLDDFNEWNVQTWYRDALYPCLALLLSNDNGVQVIPLLRRRVVWLVGCLSSRLPSVSGAFKSLAEALAADTSRHNDIPVKLSATQVISTMASNFDEAMEEGVSHATFVVNSLYKLANECDELESQSNVLDTIPLVLTYIIGTGRDITREVATAAVAPLPSVWDACGLDRLILRRNVVSILTIVVASIAPPDVNGLLPIVLPIITSSLDLGSNTDHSFLVGDALLLLLSILRILGTYNETIGAIVRLVVKLVEKDFEHLRLSMMITEMYILVGGKTFLSAYADTISRLLHLTVGQVRPRGAKYVGLVLEALLREYPSDGGLLLQRDGVLTTMLQSCASSYANGDQRESDKVLAVYLNSLARVLYESPGILDETLPIGNNGGLGASFSLTELLQLYLRLLADQTDVFSQSLWIKFLLTLLSLPEPSRTAHSRLSEALFNVMDEFLPICADVLPRLLSGYTPGSYQPEYTSDEETVDTGQERYEAFLRISQSKDPLDQVPLKDLVGLKLAPFCKSDDAHCRALLDRTNPQVLVSLNKIFP